MPRVVSFIVLLAIVLLIGSMFFQVMVQFIVPLFLAAVLVVIFKPLHAWILFRCGKRPHLTAALTTLAIVLIVLLPLTGLLIAAVSEGSEIYRDFGVEHHAEAAVPQADAEPIQPEPVGRNSLSVVVQGLVTEVNQQLTNFHLPTMPAEDVAALVLEKMQTVVTPLALGGVRFLASTLVGLAIMILALYYFFSDGPAMVETLMRLSPLDDVYEKQLLDKFSDISRAVVLATLASAVVQGLLAGAGYYFAGVDHLVFFTAATIFMSMVPFVGAAAVWILVCGLLHFLDGETTAAIVLAIYCLAIVSMADNIIKPFILHGQSNLHPLLALLSVIGGVQVLGPIGILVGPMLVAFLQALLVMLNTELRQLDRETVAAAVSPRVGSQKKK